MDLLPELKKLAHVGAVLPSDKELQQKWLYSIWGAPVFRSPCYLAISRNYTMQRPGLTSIAVQKGSIFYVNWTSQNPWVRSVVQLHGLTAVRLIVTFRLHDDTIVHVCIRLRACLPGYNKVNAAGATQITFSKFGFDYSFRLAMLLAEWVQPAHEIPLEKEAEIREMIKSLRFQEVSS